MICLVKNLGGRRLYGHLSPARSLLAMVLLATTRTCPVHRLAVICWFWRRPDSIHPSTRKEGEWVQPTQQSSTLMHRPDRPHTNIRFANGVDEVQFRHVCGGYYCAKSHKIRRHGGGVGTGGRDNEWYRHSFVISFHIPGEITILCIAGATLKKRPEIARLHTFLTESLR
jgi:hypothetical protein